MKLDDMEWDIINDQLSLKTRKKYFGDYDSLRVWEYKDIKSFTVRYNSYDIVTCKSEEDAVKACMQLKILLNIYGTSKTIEESVTKGLKLADIASLIYYDSEVK